MIGRKITQIIIDNIDMQKPLHDIDIDLKLADIGVNSITFIGIVVAIETEFDFEFGDEDLNHNKFPNLESLVSYVQNKVSQNHLQY